MRIVVKLIWCYVTTIIFLPYCDGVRCLTCTSYVSNEDCNSKGRILDCNGNQVCENTVRVIGVKKLITKRCRPIKRCSNKCLRNGDNSVCHQCCSDSNCNQDLLTPTVQPGLQQTAAKKVSSGCPRVVLRYGSVRCEAAGSGYVCVFWCRLNFVLRGPSRIKCEQTDAGYRWSNQAPACVESHMSSIHYDNPGACRNLEYDKETVNMRCTNRYSFRSSCIFTCKEGYYMISSITEEVIPTGIERAVCWRGMVQPVVWTSFPPKCIEKRCEILVQNSNSYAYCTNWRLLGSVCSFNCEIGYKLIGDRYIKCRNGDENALSYWNGTAPICQPRECEPFEYNEDLLSVFCTNENYFASNCTFNCRKGYYMTNGGGLKMVRGNELTSSCKVSRYDEMVWRPSPPNCAIKTCPEISSLLDGSVTCTNGNRYKSTCKFSCLEAFILVGTDVTTCDDPDQSERYGVWDAERPWCRPKVCSKQEYTQKELQVDCTDGDNYESVCTFTCETGYFMTTADQTKLIESGSSTTECQISDKREMVWTGEVPVCHRKSCEKLGPPENGDTSCTDSNNHDSECSFTCLRGYVVNGPEKVVCVDSGSHFPKQNWNFDPPTCKAKPCKNLVYDKLNTNVDCSKKYSYLSICSFKCKRGFYMTSSETGDIIDIAMTICNFARGTEKLEWTKSAPTCLLKTCSKLSVPTNGRLKCTDGRNHGSTCKFSCLPGYAPDSENIVKCEDDGFNKPDGRWSKRAPSCKRRSCPNLEVDMSTMFMECDSEFLYQSKCAFACKKGYYMTSNNGVKVIKRSNIECEVNNDKMVWSQQPPKCLLKTCSVINNPKRGFVRCNSANNYGSVCLFICSPGFYISGSTSITCEDNGLKDPNGEWSNPPATCERKSCETQIYQREIMNKTCTMGDLFETICTFTCNKGHYLYTDSGTATKNRELTKCGVTRKKMTWSSEAPKCRIKICTELRDPVNGKVTCSNDYIYNSICAYTCEPGYEVKGSAELKCVERVENEPEGKWSDKVSVCKERSCPALLYDKKILDMTCDKEDKFKSVCQFSCNTGYYMKGKDNEYLPIATSQCAVDVDNTTMFWSESSPTCHIKLCIELQNPQDGTVTCTNKNLFGTECTFSCQSGFKLVGTSSLICLDVEQTAFNGEWSDQAPICEARSCPALVYDEEIVTIDCTNKDKFRSVCSFGCVKGYYMTSEKKKTVVNTAETTCAVKRNDEMYWTDSSPTCALKYCSNVKKPKDGTVICTAGNAYESNCTFSCSIVREILGVETISCGADDRNVPEGIWSAPFPKCQLRSCPDFEYDKRSITQTCSNDYKYGSSCFFSCNKGYYLPDETGKPAANSETVGKCGIEGTVMTWTGGPPKCEIKTCKPLQYPVNGTYTCTEGSNYNSRCTFECSRGFLLIGSKVARCVDNRKNIPTGVWSTKEPICEARYCDDLEYDTTTMTADCDHGKKYSSVCQFSCIEGYYMTAKDGVTLVNSSSVSCDVSSFNNLHMLWRGKHPKCFVKTCPKIEFPVDGSIQCPNGTEFGKKCLFGCLPGFQMIGLAQMTCREDERNVPNGVWSKEPPICEPKSCAQLIKDNNSTQVKCTDGWKYRSLCSFTCKEGYFITKGDGRSIIRSGKGFTKCGRGTGEGMAWTRQLPKCLSKFCSVLRPTKNMTMSCTGGFQFGSKCSFSCDKPIRLAGPPTLTCLDNPRQPFSGRWDNRKPKCGKK